MLKVCGKIVNVHAGFTAKGKPFNRLQVLSTAGNGQVRLYEVTDYANETWKDGASVEITCEVEPYQSKRGGGLRLGFYHFPNGNGNGKNAAAPGAGSPPPGSGDAAASHSGSGGKFS